MTKEQKAKEDQNQKYQRQVRTIIEVVKKELVWEQRVSPELKEAMKSLAEVPEDYENRRELIEFIEEVELHSKKQSTRFRKKKKKTRTNKEGHCNRSMKTW